jgi:hypothetical protein
MVKKTVENPPNTEDIEKGAVLSPERRNLSKWQS